MAEEEQVKTNNDIDIMDIMNTVINGFGNLVITNKPVAALTLAYMQALMYRHISLEIEKVKKND